MAIKYGFFNSVNGDRVYNAEDLGRYLQGLVSSGVYADRSDSLQVLANGDLTVTVQPGRAMLNCHYMENDAPLVLALEPADSARRIDAVVMRLDLAERTCSIYVKTGIASAGQVSAPAPSLTRYDNAWEWELAEIFVAAHATAITQSAITDTRANTEVCGWVTGLIKQVDTAALFAQWQAAYEEQYGLYEANIAAQAAAYNEWLASLVEGDTVNGLPVTVRADEGKPVVVNRDGTGYELGDVPFPFTEDVEHHACYSRLVSGEKEWVNPPRVWASQNNAYCVYRARRTAERWGDYASGDAQKPVYVVEVDVLKVQAGSQSYAVQLPEGAKVVGFSGNFFDDKQGCHANPVVDVYSSGPYIAAYAKYVDGLLKVYYNVPDGGVELQTARFTIKYVL